MLIDLTFNRHFAIKARASLHNIIHAPAIICRRSMLCIISYNAYKYQTVCCVISLNLPECCLTMSGKTKEKRKELSLSDKVNVIKEFEKSGKGQILLAEQFGVGKTQIQQTIKWKAEYI